MVAAVCVALGILAAFLILRPPAAGGRAGDARSSSASWRSTSIAAADASGAWRSQPELGLARAGLDAGVRRLALTPPA